MVKGIALAVIGICLVIVLAALAHIADRDNDKEGS